MYELLFSGTLFSILLIGLSYWFNSRVLGGRLHADPYELTLTAGSVFLLAIVAESLINPLYELYAGQKLWEYRLLPLHDRNVSGLAILIWTAYGVHLYFTQQNLDRWLLGDWRNRIGKSLVFGLEAPFFFEITGNLFFLYMLGQHYAYYLPGEVFHLTSIQVIPVYMICILIGVIVLHKLYRLPRHWSIPPALFTGGLVYLGLG